MLNKMIVIAVIVATSLMTPAKVDAYGACHVGYTHVGPNGVQHYGETAYRGPNSSGYAQHGSAYGAGGAYHAGSGAAYGGAYGGAYHYSGGTAAGGYHYNYVR
jgi:hypothetical protein